MVVPSRKLGASSHHVVNYTTTTLATLPHHTTQAHRPKLGASYYRDTITTNLP